MMYMRYSNLTTSNNLLLYAPKIHNKPIVIKKLKFNKQFIFFQKPVRVLVKGELPQEKPLSSKRSVSQT